MKNPVQEVRCTGLFALLLAICLAFSPFVFHESAHAQMKIARTQTTSAASLSAEVTRWRGRGRVIVVSLSRQRLYAYRHGRLVFSAAVTTGQPALPTPRGSYRVFAKYSPITFRSPFPRRSHYWYPPTHINYALEWRRGYYLHDSWWRTVYGRGTNRLHRDPVYGWEPGSHGCVSMSLGAARWLYHWAPVGTVVRIVR
jgi:lipoprotein-anchoring transpeptidase ErfK/SrfK